MGFGEYMMGSVLNMLDLRGLCDNQEQRPRALEQRR